MKLRLRANTIRLRLIKSEVERLSAGETIIETLPTPRPFHYRVEPLPVTDLSADFSGDTLTIAVPEDWARGWALSDEVGRGTTSAGIDILIEKDWSCTVPRFAEDNDGTYPNPSALS